MANIAIVGNSWGDEAKGAITHWFSKDYDFVCRTSGGSNAGHTIYRDGVKYVHNLIPSFDWRHERPKAFLSSGMVIDLEQLYKEVAALKNINVSLPLRIFVDPEAFVVLKEHKEEDKKLNGHIGSTNRGIGPAYKSKIGRYGVRIRDFMNGNCSSDSSELILINEMKKMGVHFSGILELKPKMLGKNMLYEGAQGVMLDINHGTYPYVSCGDSTVAGIYASGFHFAKPDKVYGVAKCYNTKVGEGPFPTEIFGDEAEALRKKGNEYGATTGRPRRVGWIDLPAMNYACQKGGIDSLILTKFDILNGMDRVNMCVAYEKKPICPADFFNAKILYASTPGWKDATKLDQLHDFVKIVEHYVSCPVEYVSHGITEKSIVRFQ